MKIIGKQIYVEKVSLVILISNKSHQKQNLAIWIKSTNTGPYLACLDLLGNIRLPLTKSSLKNTSQ